MRDLEKVVETLNMLFSDSTNEDYPFTEEFAMAVKEAISALEKQIPKKPITYKSTNRADCPCCGNVVRGIQDSFGNWCSKCGQRLDWSEESEQTTDKRTDSGN